MKKSYLLCYSDSLGTRTEVKETLNSMSIISHWRFDMPNSFYLVSTESGKTISDQLRSLRKNKGRFIITEIDNNYYGWLDSESWHLIQKKDYKPK